MPSSAVLILVVQSLYLWRVRCQEVITTINLKPFLTDLPTEVEVPPAALRDGEDAASATLRAVELRAAEPYGLLYDAEVLLEIATSFREALSGKGYKPPKELTLRTGGAYVRRADEAIKEKRFADGAADCLRALLRPGIDSTARDLFVKKLGSTLLRMERIREMRLEEQAAEERDFAEQKAEADALSSEWKVLLEEDERVWKGVDDWGRGGNCGETDGECPANAAAHLSTSQTLTGASDAFSKAWDIRNFTQVVAAAREIPAESRSESMQLVVARCHLHLGSVKDSLKTITSLLTNCDKSGDWQDGEPRVIAATSGAALAMSVGDVDRVKKMYQIVLRSDPEQQHIKKRYKVLRTFMRILTDIEELLRNSKNHDAMKGVERSKKVLEKVMGIDAARTAATRLLLFECTAKSRMTFHDDAIEACNTAIGQLENHDNPNPASIAEAYAWRAEANMRDRSYDDAVADYQVSLQKVPNSQDYQEKLENAKKKQKHWNESEEQHDNRGRSLGHFPKHRPMRELLDLPENIDELEKDDKCKRLKKAFHKMSLRWHPDKAKGGARRAQRKTAEISEAKAFLEQKFGCRGRR